MFWTKAYMRWNNLEVCCCLLNFSDPLCFFFLYLRLRRLLSINLCLDFCHLIHFK